MKYSVVLALLLAAVVSGQTLVVSTANARETVVSGTATVGSGPITVINVQFPAEVKLGTGEVLRDGTFAVAVKTSLIEGHALVVADKSGRRSAKFTVKPPRSGPTPPALPGK